MEQEPENNELEEVLRGPEMELNIQEIKKRLGEIQGEIGRNNPTQADKLIMDLYDQLDKIEKDSVLG